MDTTNKAFNEFLRFRSPGEGGYADAYTDPEDPAHKDPNNITVRGLITPAFEYWINKLGIAVPAGSSPIELQISMLRGANEPNANVTFSKWTPAGFIAVKSETPLQPSYRKKEYKVPGISAQELAEPTNELYKKIVWHQAGFDVMNPKLSTALQFVFANFYFAGGGIKLFPDDPETYTWAGGFKEWLKRNRGLKVSGKGKNGRVVTDQEAVELNANESEVIDQVYDYAMYRFKLNSPEAWNTYKRGWENAAINIRNKATELSEKKSSVQKAQAKVQTFWNKHKKKIIVSLIILIVVLAGYFIYKKYGKKKG